MKEEMPFPHKTSSWQTLWLAVSVLIVVSLTTIPRLAINYGMEGDSIRVVGAGEQWLQTGRYQPSRGQGYPIFELLVGLLAPWGGPLATNAFVLTTFSMSILAFFFLVRERENAVLWTGTFALTPILLMNAATTMDYIPALALLLGSYVFARRNNHALASILLGFAAGFRLTNIVFVLPLAIFLYSKHHRLSRITFFSALSIVIAMSFYIPVFLEHGLGIFGAFNNLYSGWEYVLFTVYKGLNLFGPIATLGLTLTIFFNIKRIRQMVQLSRYPSGELLVEVASIAIFSGLWIIHSEKPAFLIPAIPFFYLLLSRWLPRKQLIYLGILIVTFAFFTVELKGGESGRNYLTIKPAWGVIIDDYLGRNELVALRKAIGQFDFSDKAVIMTGMGPVLGYQNSFLRAVDYREISPGIQKDGIWVSNEIYKIDGRNVFFVNGMSKENFLLLKNQGYQLWIFSYGAPTYMQQVYGYDPIQLGARKLEVLNENAFYKLPVR